MASRRQALATGQLSDAVKASSSLESWGRIFISFRESVGAEPFNGDAREPQRRCGCHPTVVSNTADNAVDSAIRRVLRVLAVGQVVMARSMGQLDVLRDMKEAEGGLYVPSTPMLLVVCRITHCSCVRCSKSADSATIQGRHPGGIQPSTLHHEDRSRPTGEL